MHRFLAFALLALCFAPPYPALAGVVNPDISVIGQPTLTWNDLAGDPSRKRPVFNVGETEFVFDAALNPYARGWFTLSLADGEVEVEEGYFSLLRGLPGGIQLKGGKYRAGFGKLNPAHPHTYPFAERFGVLAAYLPGDEAFNETGLDVSWRLPLPGTWAVTASADVLQGDTFRIPRPASADPNDPLIADPVNGDRTLEPRAAWVGRLASFVGVGDRSGIELGVSATQGTNNVAANARTTVYGGDVKAKLWTSANAYLLLQGEYLHLDRDIADWSGTSGRYSVFTTRVNGGYAFADFNWKQRYNVGASVDRYDDPVRLGESVTSAGLFAGLALMEETTAFRLDWRRSDRSGGPTIPFAGGSPVVPYDPVQQLTLRVIFSMGPHKAHQF